MKTLSLLMLAVGAFLAAPAAFAADNAVDRGEYLVTIAGCNDCHTPGYFLGKPDFAHALSGSDVGFTIPGVGAFIGRNLTPDKETGLGKWSDDEIIAAITKGVRPDGRKLARSCPGRNSPRSRQTTRRRSSPISEVCCR